MQFSLLKTLLQIYKGLPLFGVIYDEQDSKIENESGENRRVTKTACRPGADRRSKALDHAIQC